MDENESKKIAFILKEFYKYEKFIKNPPQNIAYKGFLIEKDLMDNYKKKIYYEELKPQINNKVNLENTKLTFDKMKECKNILNPIIQTNFNNWNELYKALDSNKKYWIIPYNLWSLICKPENKNDKGIKFLFQGNKILLTLNENEKIDFSINNGIIEKSSLLTEIKLLKNQKIAIKCLNKKNIINEEQIIKDIKFDAYSCINCKSEIEIESIDFNPNNDENSLTFNCMGNCGKKTVFIKEYFNKMINNIYLSEKCSSCKKVQLEEYIKDNKNIFIYCIECKKIFCNQCKNECGHHNNIKINELKNMCLIHKKNISPFIMIMIECIYVMSA